MAKPEPTLEEATREFVAATGIIPFITRCILGVAWVVERLPKKKGRRRG